jgi:hypothetical protein
MTPSKSTRSADPAKGDARDPISEEIPPGHDAPGAAARSFRISSLQHDRNLVCRRHASPLASARFAFAQE